VYRYFTWTDSEGFFKSHQLLKNIQISKLLEHTSVLSEAFASIQSYDASGECIGCPVYFDIDSPSLWDAYHEMRELVEDLRATLDVEPWVYFSGSKGFHVVCPIFVRHKRCHEIVKMMAGDITDIGDRSVYRQQAMWRCNGTWNEKGRRRKVQVLPDQPLDMMLRDSSHGDLRKYDVPFSYRDADISGYVKRLPEINLDASKYGSDFSKHFFPCMKQLWAMEEPPSGYRHQIAHIFARHCYRSGLTLEEAEAMFQSHDYWANVPRSEGHYPFAILRSVYRSGHGNIGCKQGRDSDLLKDYCSNFCVINEKACFTYLFKGEKDEKLATEVI
jgi:hypothetical protein